MAFISNIPQATDKLSVSQGNLLGNFTSLGTVLNGVDTLACLFPLLGASPATGANIIGLYNKGNQLVWRQPTSGTEIDFTTFNGNTSGWSKLPSGLIVAWNTFTSSAGGIVNQVLSWPVGTAPTFASVLWVIMNPWCAAATAAPQNVQLYFASYNNGTSTLTYYAANGTGTVPYAGLGYNANVLLIGI